MDIKVIGIGVLLLLAMAVAGVFTSHNAIANPSSPVKAPEISFSSGESSQVSSTQAEIEALNHQVEVILSSVPDSNLAMRLEKEAESEGESTDESTKAKVIWTTVVKNGHCKGSLNSTHKIFKEGNWYDIEIEENLNHTSPMNAAFPCTEWDITVMFARWVQKAIQAKVGITEILFVIKTAYDNVSFKLNLALSTDEFLTILGLGGK